MIGLGEILTKIVFDGNSGWDVEVNRWFAHRRTATWNDISNYGSHAAETLTVIGIAAVAVLILAVFRYWREIELPRDRPRARGLGVRDGRRSSSTVPRPPVVRLDTAPPTSSFPSGHTAAASCSTSVWR